MKSALLGLAHRIAGPIVAPLVSQVLDDRLAELKALQLLAPLSAPFVPWPKPALRPYCLATLLNDVVIHQRKRLVELGGGVSTLYIARLLRLQGGHLVTVEEDEKWAELLQKLLAAEKLDSFVSIIAARIKPGSFLGQSLPWYDCETLTAKLPSGRFDLLLVDGPASQSGQPLIRYPALPFFSDRLEAQYSLVLDDATRRDEKEVVRRWSKEFGLQFRVAGGFAYANQSGDFKVFV